MVDFMKLQNGSDIRGVALKTETEDVNLTENVVRSIGASFAKWLCDNNNKANKISLGRDSRITGEQLLKNTIEGIKYSGLIDTCADLGIASTPCMFMTTINTTDAEQYDGAIMITASHLPYNRNGLKFFTAAGGLDKKDIKVILTYAQEIYENVVQHDFSIYKNDDIIKSDFLISHYCKHLINTIREAVNDKNNYNEPLKDIKIVVDAGNGAGGFFVEYVLEPLGAICGGSLYLEPDGYFPNHIPNPEDKKAIESIIAATTEAKADIGIIFDTDVDRSGCCSKDGQEINRNRFIALMSAIILEQYPNTTIVTDSVTSAGLKTFIENTLGGIHYRFQRGYKNVINRGILLNEQGQETHLAIETSGHGAIKDNHFLDDGAYSIVLILIKLAKMRLNNEGYITDLIKDLKEPVEAEEFRLNILKQPHVEIGNEIIEKLSAYVQNEVDDWRLAVDNHEGVRVENDNGWFLVRLSLHDPLLVINVESEVNGGNDSMIKGLATFLDSFKNVIELKKLINK